MRREMIKGQVLSGTHYIRADQRKPEDGDIEPIQIRIFKEANCDHTTTICTKKECAESWSIDHHLMFWRTSGGRRVARALGVSIEKDVDWNPLRLKEVT